MKLFELLPCVDLPGQRSLTIAPPIDLMVKQALCSREHVATRWPPSRRDALPSKPVRAANRVRDSPTCGDHRIASWSYEPSSGVTGLPQKSWPDSP